MGDVTNKKSKAFATLNAKLKELDGRAVKVGWFDSARYEDGTPVAYIAAIQEMGSGAIPPRSFFRTTKDEQKDAWMRDAGNLAGQVTSGGMNAIDAMTQLGARIEGDVQKKIASITTPPLSPLTIAARKYRQMGKKVTGKTLGELSKKIADGTMDVTGVSTKPLNDTGNMIATLTSVVE